RAHATEAASAIDALDDDELATLLDEIGQLGWAEVLAERHHDAIRHMTRAVRSARRTGQSHLLPYLLLCASYAHQEIGHLARGTAAAGAAEEQAQLLDRPALAGHALTLRAAATALREGPAAADRTATEALRTVGRHGRLRDISAGILAAVRLDQGRP